MGMKRLSAILGTCAMYPHFQSDQPVLMNTAPASYEDYLLLQQERRKSAAGDIALLKALSETAPYQAGDPATEVEYYRIHFRGTLEQPQQLERLIQSLSVNFTKQSILQARAIEERL